MKRHYIKWLLCGYIAFIFVQSLFFKFSDAYETQHIFGVLGEWSGLQWFADFGAYGVGIAELIASIMLFIPAIRLLGAGLAAGIMSGAIFFHLFTPLGISMPEFNVQGEVIGNDGGLLFINACIVFTCAIIVAIWEWVGGNHLFAKH
ncbi:hypothetical protein [Spartinivicinus poritis]|uniref:DoxX family protein n=1 Tax=Spartinivicinus poritis TaxID=2994640 RepID=A0ABT5UET2_9GAMM|nr:hypothetical protein [Spartinivicinus sp. A2-2]MDE1464889.1 hypothetical protein [Spartinivicinus sp. A2-2]